MHDEGSGPEGASWLLKAIFSFVFVFFIATTVLSSLVRLWARNEHHKVPVLEQLPVIS